MNVFKCKEDMPSEDNNPNVVHPAFTRAQCLANLAPALGYGFPIAAAGQRDAMDVKNIERPRYGHKV